jgi:SAM-dependent methyltransferase
VGDVIEAFADRFGHGDQGHDSDHTIEWYERLLRPFLRRRPRRVLDVGCGPGRVIRAMARRSPSSVFVGIDGSTKITALGTEELARDGINATLATIDLTSPDLAARLASHGPFDLITSFFVLHHYAPDVVAQIIGQLRWLLASGGIVVLAECHNPADPRRDFADRTCRELAEMAGVLPDLLMTPEPLVEACLAGGFLPAEIRLMARKGWPYSKSERRVNKTLLSGMWSQVLESERAYLAAGSDLPEVHWRLKEVVRSLRRHRAALPLRVGPLLCILRSERDSEG